MKIKIIGVFFLLLVSCNNENNKIISKNGFHESKNIKGEIVNVDLGELNPFRYNVIRDSLAIIEIKSPKTSYFKVYDIKNNKEILGFGNRGRGPDELLSGLYLSNTLDDATNTDNIMIRDLVKSEILEYNIDSLILFKNDKPINKIKLPKLVNSFSKIDDNKYVCNNKFYSEIRGFENNLQELFIYREDGGDIAPNSDNCKFFTGNVSKSSLFVSPDKKTIVVANRYLSKLDFYDEKLQHLQRLEGPNIISPEYRLIIGNTVGFKKGKASHGYISGTPFGNSIYLVYIGASDLFFSQPNKSPKAEVYKIDWKGNLLKRYALDKFIYTISISSDEKYLYGTSVDSDGEKVLMKYKLF